MHFLGDRSTELCEDEDSQALISVDIKIVPPNDSNSKQLHTTNITFNSLDIIGIYMFVFFQHHKIYFPTFLIS